MHSVAPSEHGPELSIGWLVQTFKIAAAAKASRKMMLHTFIFPAFGRFVN